MATKPTVTTIASSDLLNPTSRSKLNTNVTNLKTALDAVIDEVAAIGSAPVAAQVVSLYNGSTYGNRPTGLANGLWWVIGPVDAPSTGAGARLSRDVWIRTPD